MPNKWYEADDGFNPLAMLTHYPTGEFKKIATVNKIILKNSHSFKKFKNQSCQKFLTVLLCIFLLLSEISYSFIVSFENF